MKPSRCILILAFLVTAVFSLGATLQTRVAQVANRSSSDSILQVLLGDSRRLFANHFYVKADVSFHSGYYPSIFDQARKIEEQENAIAHAGQHPETEHEEEGGFLGKPTDWIDRFGRHFKVVEHTHLQKNQMGEILPWLRISAELDPHHIETYTVAAYWLENIGKIEEADRFLRQGLQSNPKSAEILFELGEIEYEYRHNLIRARNLWIAAIHCCTDHDGPMTASDKMMLDKTATRLARLEEDDGNTHKAIEYLELAKQYSPSPASLQTLIDMIKKRAAATPPASVPPR